MALIPNPNPNLDPLSEEYKKALNNQDGKMSELETISL